MKGEILVVRDFDIFSSILSANGFSVINFQAIKNEEITDNSGLKKTTAEIENFDGIFITSPNAAAPFLKNFAKAKKTFQGKIYVLGSRANKLFNAAGIEVIFYETAKNAAELINSIPQRDLQGKKFLYLCGNRSLRIIPEMLGKFAEVRELIVYKTSATKADAKIFDKIKEKLDKRKIAVICFFSPSGAKSFIEQFGAEILHQTIIATIGKTTAEYFEQQNLRVNFVSSKAAAEDFAVELIEYLRKEN